MEVLGKLVGNYTSKIEIIPSASRYVSIKFKEQFLHVINNSDWLNGLKGSTKIHKR